jgi:hypothetical protein
MMRTFWETLYKLLNASFHFWKFSAWTVRG